MRNRLLTSAVLAAIVATLSGCATSDTTTVDVVTPTPVVETVYIEIEKEDGCVPYYSDIANSITQDEIDLVAQITWLEAGNQSMTGKRAVVEVIFNRIVSDKFPNTVHDVIFQSGQFSTAKNISISKPTQEEYDAIDRVLNESEPILDTDVLFFSPNGFKNRTSYDRIGGHVFCY